MDASPNGNRRSPRLTVPCAPSTHSKQTRDWSLMRMLYCPSRSLAKRFEPIAGQDSQIPQRCGGFQSVEFQARDSLDSGERFHPFPGGERSGVLVSKPEDHAQEYRLLCVTSSITAAANRPPHMSFRQVWAVWAVVAGGACEPAAASQAAHITSKDSARTSCGIPTAAPFARRRCRATVALPRRAASWDSC